MPEAPPDQRAVLDPGGVACWSEPVSIDTYAPAEPDRYPLFLDRRVYQGSSGKVYPMPFIDNNVIKPGLVGLAGPWISGGMEFNWPQHHRPATFLPVETSVERSDGGQVTVWHSDLDPLQRMRGSHGVRLRPGSSVVEVEARLYNRTDEPRSSLWWAYAAARVHDKYQSFFPTDVRYVADHARRPITAFPRADRSYYGVDYPALAGQDDQPDADRIDFWANIPVPTSYIVTHTRDSFFGGYGHEALAGFVHWAERSTPGKEQWTRGNGSVGKAWQAHLTDADGPYVELMSGSSRTTSLTSATWLPATPAPSASSGTRSAAQARRTKQTCTSPSRFTWTRPDAGSPRASPLRPTGRTPKLCSNTAV